MGCRLGEGLRRARLRGAGADVLYTPGLSAAKVRTVRAETTRPLNVLAYPGTTVAELAEAGAQRISVGGSLAFVGVGAMAAAAERIRDEDDFAALASEVRLDEWLPVTPGS